MGVVMILFPVSDVVMLYEGCTPGARQHLKRPLSGRFFRCAKRGSTLALGLMLAVRASADASDLAIVAPATGTTAMTGQTLSVTVSIAPDRFLRNVTVIAENPLRASDPQTVSGPTLQFRVAIPSDCSPGPYLITAAGVGEGTQLPVSPPLRIQVERPDRPSALDLTPSAMRLTFVGQSRALHAIAAFADGTHNDVGRSTRLMATSANPAVAIVRDGSIVALRSGQTAIEVRYGSLSAALPVEIPLQFRGDLNADGRVDALDMRILTDAMHQPASVIGDARDLNHDGVIDELDQALLASLCTQRGCGP